MEPLTPANSPRPADAPLRFLDAFLSERNIHWILSIGVAILFGSTLMLVLSNHDRLPTEVRQLVPLGYSLAAAGLAALFSRRLALRRTGNVLHGLSVALIPLALVALRQSTDPSHASRAPPIMFWVLFAIEAAAAYAIVGQASRHFLRGTQRTYTTAFVLLSLAGPFANTCPSVLAPWFALALWGAFAAGAIKVNRHVFWLIEERRAPRILGFVPMLLLAALFAIEAAPLFRSLSWDWCGVLAVLAGVPVLLCADAVARVFQQRTGDLVRPWPWPVVAPIVVGQLLAIAGTIVTALPLVESRQPYALPLAAVLAAITSLVLGKRLQSSVPVWISLVLFSLAYRYLPVYFAETMRTIVVGTSAAIVEPKLPLAFYGLTFLPFLMVLTLWARREIRAGREYLARPLEIFATRFSLLLLMLAPTQLKALLPAGLALSIVFALQAWAFAHRGWALAGMISWVVAAVGAPLFARGVFAIAVPQGAELVALVAAGVSLLAVAPVLNPVLRRLKRSSIQFAGIPATFSECWIGGLFACQAAVIWAAMWHAVALVGAVSAPIVWINAAILAGVVPFGLAALRRGDPTLGMVFVVDLAIAVTCGCFFPVAVRDIPQALAAAWSVQAAVALLLSRYPQTRIGKGIGVPAWQVSHAGLWVIFATIAAPTIFRSACRWTIGLAPIAMPLGYATFGLFAALVVLELSTALKSRNEPNAWLAMGVMFVAAIELLGLTQLSLRDGGPMFVPLGMAAALWGASTLAGRSRGANILARPFRGAALALPAITVALGVVRFLQAEIVGPPAGWLGMNSLAILLAAGAYFAYGLERRRREALVAATAIVNLSLALLWRELRFTDPQCFMIPIGCSLLVLVQLLKREIPVEYRNPLRYAGALAILVSPTFNIVQGSWLHMVSLLVVSTAMAFVGIGMRLRALLYAGAAFCLADLVAMVVRGSASHPEVLWGSGLALGAAVVAAGAYFELQRERAMQQMRALTAALQTWE